MILIDIKVLTLRLSPSAPLEDITYRAPGSTSIKGVSASELDVVPGSSELATLFPKLTCPALVPAGLPATRAQFLEKTVSGTEIVYVQAYRTEHSLRPTSFGLLPPSTTLRIIFISEEERRLVNICHDVVLGMTLPCRGYPLAPPRPWLLMLMHHTSDTLFTRTRRNPSTAHPPIHSSRLPHFLCQIRFRCAANVPAPCSTPSNLDYLYHSRFAVTSGDRLVLFPSNFSVGCIPAQRHPDHHPPCHLEAESRVHQISLDVTTLNPSPVPQ